ncbi:MAG: hypothetical protein LUH15_09915 [Tannerellaceae bacterium]|nr:hypothetical protein [Tannerellaceae bacterium]
MYTHENDKGKVNYKKALWYAKRAASQGEVNVYSLLAQFYFKGAGTTRNIVEAYKWAKLADANGNTKSLPVLEYIEQNFQFTQSGQLKEKYFKRSKMATALLVLSGILGLMYSFYYIIILGYIESTYSIKSFIQDISWDLHSYFSDLVEIYDINRSYANHPIVTSYISIGKSALLLQIIPPIINVVAIIMIIGWYRKGLWIHLSLVFLYLLTGTYMFGLSIGLIIISITTLACFIKDKQKNTIFSFLFQNEKIKSYLFGFGNDSSFRSNSKETSYYKIGMIVALIIITLPIILTISNILFIGMELRWKEICLNPLFLVG